MDGGLRGFGKRTAGAVDANGNSLPLLTPLLNALKFRLGTGPWDPKRRRLGHLAQSGRDGADIDFSL